MKKIVGLAVCLLALGGSAYGADGADGKADARLLVAKTKTSDSLVESVVTRIKSARKALKIAKRNLSKIKSSNLGVRALEAVWFDALVPGLSEYKAKKAIAESNLEQARANLLAAETQLHGMAVKNNPEALYAWAEYVRKSKDSEREAEDYYRAAASLGHKKAEARIRDIYDYKKLSFKDKRLHNILPDFLASKVLDDEFDDIHNETVAARRKAAGG